MESKWLAEEDADFQFSSMHTFALHCMQNTKTQEYNRKLGHCHRRSLGSIACNIDPFGGKICGASGNGFTVRAWCAHGAHRLQLHSFHPPIGPS